VKNNLTSGGNRGKRDLRRGEGSAIQQFSSLYSYYIILEGGGGGERHGSTQDILFNMEVFHV